MSLIGTTVSFVYSRHTKKTKMLGACIAMVRRIPLILYFLFQKRGSRGTLAQLFKDMVADALQMLFMTIKPLMVSSNPSSGAQEEP